jgi:aldose 1-epimerase
VSPTGLSIPPGDAGRLRSRCQRRDGPQTALNIGERRLPYGIGFHPYLTVGTQSIDDALLEVPARVRLITDDREIPTGERAAVEGSTYGFRQERPIGGTQLDSVFTDLERDADGRVSVTLSDSAGGRRLRVWLGDAYRWLMAFTGDTLPERGRRRRSLGIEPMTCPPNALRSGEGLHVLRPGNRHCAEWGIAWS